MVYAKRGGSCCVCSFVLEVIALAAALIAITGTFWLDPITTDVGSVLPGVEHAGLWKVCYPESGVQLASPGGVVVESRLPLQLVEAVNSEVCQRVIQDVGDAVAWLKSTFLYCRMRREPERYGPAKEARPADLDAALRARPIKGFFVERLVCAPSVL